ncbi:MAG: glycoside hydrolase family 18 protein [Acidobacteriaceae bacterium]
MSATVPPQLRGFPFHSFYWECCIVKRPARLLLPLALALGALSSPAQANSKKFVIAAYVFPRNTVLTADQVAAKKLTRINFAFANIYQGRIVEGDPSDAANLAMLVGLKKENPELTVLVSVGGWLWSGRFSDAALTPASRARFIDSVAGFIARYKLDGLDIDWEYPAMEGAAGNVFRPEDKQNYTLLLKELRDRFKKMQKPLHRRLYISIAAGASTEFLEHTEMGKVQKYVDTVNLMAYDYYEPGDDKLTGNHAPLFVDPADPKGISADRSVKEFEAAGVPAEKIVLGVPFYGHVWGHVPATNHGLFQTGGPVPNAYANYGALSTTMLSQGYTRYWDAKASVPYLYNPQKQIFVSYEDPESLALKCKYVIDRHLAGMMFWEYGSDPSGKLLDSIDLGLAANRHASGQAAQ